MSEFRMPSLGADMEFGTLLEWLVKPGDSVKRGDIVAVVDTSKAEIEVEIFEDGVIDELLVPEHTKVPVGTVLATLRTPATEPVRPTEAPPPTEVPPTAASPHGRPRVSPLARRTAERLGVDLASVVGTGPEGAIGREDVARTAPQAGGPAPVEAPGPAEAAEPAGAAAPVEAPGPAKGAEPAGAAAPVEAPGPAKAAEPAGAAAPVEAPGSSEVPAPGAPPRPASQGEERRTAMREAIGALMARSKREIPHYYLQREIDMSRAMAWLEQENSRRGVDARLISSVLLLAAVARAASQTPAMNGFWVEDRFQPAPAVHLGVAIAQRGEGLIAPALRDADAMSLDELMAALRELVGRVRGGRLRASEMSDSTITVTNLGDGGVDLVHGVIYPPQVALVGFGGVEQRAHAVGGMLGVRPTVIATLAADHRVSDGRTGGRFLSLIERLLQAPEEL